MCKFHNLKKLEIFNDSYNFEFYNNLIESSPNLEEILINMDSEMNIERVEKF